LKEGVEGSERSVLNRVCGDVRGNRDVECTVDILHMVDGDWGVLFWCIGALPECSGVWKFPNP